MRVSTTHAKAVNFRRQVIEWLMLNHPLDCPVCDEGGHCLLQDMTISGGHSIRRYQGDKRTYQDQYLGPLIQHEMNRCIQCYRCTRYYQEYCGYNDLGVMGIANRIYFGRMNDGTLENPFSGNIVDICPTGVFTDKPARYAGRRWDFTRKPSICIHCSLGCSTTVSTRLREVVRQEARFNPAVNGHFICDRGRFGFYYVNQAQRPRQGRIDGQIVDAKAALIEAKRQLAAITDKYGRDSVAVVGSVRSSLESLISLSGLCQAQGYRGPVFWTNEALAEKMDLIVEAQTFSMTETATMPSLKEADFILSLNCDPINEAPMLALAMRQAVRNGAHMIAVDPRPLALPFACQHLPVRLREQAVWLSMLMAALKRAGLIPEIDQTLQEQLNALGSASDDILAAAEKVAEALVASHKPVMVLGAGISGTLVFWLATRLALLIKSRSMGQFFVLPGPNAFGAALLGLGRPVFEQILSKIETGRIKAMIVLENDLLGFYPKPERVNAALSRLELLVAADYLLTASSKLAHIFIPSQSIYEGGGIFINQSGQVQRAMPVFKGGIPISISGDGTHPPRQFQSTIPAGADILSGWEINTTLAGKAFPEGWTKMLANLETTRASSSGAGWTSVKDFDLIIKNYPIDSMFSRRPCSTWYECPLALEDDSIDLIFTEQTFGSEILSAESPCLQALVSSPQAMMNAEDAHQMGLTEEGLLAMDYNQGTLVLPLKTMPCMAQKTIVVPRLEDVSQLGLSADTLCLRPEQIRKI